MLNPWSINPAWQNFSSMVREAIAAREARTGMERSHHLTAALYFGVASLEAFINERTRTFLSGQRSEQEIVDVLRYGRLRERKKADTLLDKLTAWPEIIAGRSVDLREGSAELIDRFNRTRGDLTHIKTNGEDLYRLLETTDPDTVVDVVAEYVAQYHQASGSQFPYWLWGWNYLNPRSQSYEIMLLNEQQFVHSMRALGSSVAASLSTASMEWQQKFMSDYNGYRSVAAVLIGLDYCEPKHSRFPFQPKLCRRWWASDHHASCGHVSAEAIERADR
jgi:hypothetical protein